MIRIVVLLLGTLAVFGVEKPDLATTKPVKHQTLMERELLFKESGLLKDHFFGYTPLLQAALAGKTAEVEKTLHRPETNVNWKMEWGYTAMMLAADQGYTPIVKLLIEHQADLDAQNEDGLTALMLAAREGRIDVVKVLMHHRAKTELKDAARKTALDWAREKQHSQIVQLLTQ